VIIPPVIRLPFFLVQQQHKPARVPALEHSIADKVSAICSSQHHCNVATAIKGRSCSAPAGPCASAAPKSPEAPKRDPVAPAYLGCVDVCTRQLALCGCSYGLSTTGRTAARISRPWPFRADGFTSGGKGGTGQSGTVTDRRCAGRGGYLLERENTWE
jgi:hypothetical protein